jgi:hypothetical protein
MRLEELVGDASSMVLARLRYLTFAPKRSVSFFPESRPYSFDLGQAVLRPVCPFARWLRLIREDVHLETTPTT